MTETESIINDTNQKNCWKRDKYLRVQEGKCPPFSKEKSVKMDQS